MDSEDGFPQSSPDVKSIWLISFADLVSLLLAFFVMLFALSTVEPVKSLQVMGSLSSAFASVLPPTTDPTEFTSKEEGDFLNAKQTQEEVAGVFSTAIPAVKVEVVQPGRQMRLTLPSAALFFENEPRVRSAHEGLIDRIAGTLAARRSGQVAELEFVIGTPTGGGRSLPVSQTLEYARAGAFAREMTARGAPPASLSVGVKAGNPGEVTLWFYVRPASDARPRLKSDERAKEAGRAT